MVIINGRCQTILAGLGGMLVYRGAGLGKCNCVCIGGDRMRSTYYPGVCTCSPKYLLSKFHCTRMYRHEVGGKKEYLRIFTYLLLHHVHKPTLIVSTWFSTYSWIVSTPHSVTVCTSCT